jgi:ribonuclease T1
MKLKIYGILLFLLTFLACNQGQRNQHSREDVSKNQSQEQKSRQRNDGIPDKAYQVLKYVRANGEAMNGYVGGRTFQNREKRLSLTDENGKKIRYQEWDVNPKVQGQNRGAERLITSPTKAYYTGDHYRTFQELKE